SLFCEDAAIKKEHTNKSSANLMIPILIVYLFANQLFVRLFLGFKILALSMIDQNQEDQKRPRTKTTV
ncbi:hypothetical protein DD595_24950, partial [Enterobacter cloacae complex sp. 4DZ3-17B2]